MLISGVQVASEHVTEETAEEHATKARATPERNMFTVCHDMYITFYADALAVHQDARVVLHHQLHR